MAWRRTMPGSTPWADVYAKAAAGLWRETKPFASTASVIRARRGLNRPQILARR